MPQVAVIKEQLAHSIQHQRLTHAYIFSGEHGTGKKETALWLTARLFCLQLNGNDPCGQCVNCKRIYHENHPDVHWIRPDGQTIKVEDIQYLRTEFLKTSVEGGKKVFIIEEADAMTPSAANRLLTFIEEPKTDMLALLLTSREEAILPTIRSRCQLLSFTAAPTIALDRQLQDEGVNPATAHLLSQLTNQYDTAKAWLDDETFLTHLGLLDQWFQQLMTKDAMAFVYVQQQLVAQTTDIKQVQQWLDILMIKAKEQYQNAQARQLTQAIITAKQHLMSHVNVQSVLEQLAWHCLREEE